MIITRYSDITKTIYNSLTLLSNTNGENYVFKAKKLLEEPQDRLWLKKIWPNFKIIEKDERY
jgi:hypothetical protein